MASEIRDLQLWQDGRLKIEWVRHHMPLLNGLEEEFRQTLPFKGKKVAKGVRAIVIPATQDNYLKAIESGIAKIFIEAGCVVSTPTCGPCLGGHMGVMAQGERSVSTTNRNLVGRMGHTTSEIILASPAVAAASAIAGCIAEARAI